LIGNGAGWRDHESSHAAGRKLVCDTHADGGEIDEGSMGGLPTGGLYPP